MSRCRARALPCIALAALAFGSACAGEDPSDQPTASELSIVVTTSIWGDVVERVVADNASVDVLIGPGQDAHAFDPSAQQVASVLDADLVVANGLDLEEGMADLLSSAEREGVPVLEMAPLLDPIVRDEEHEGDEPSGDGHDEDDAHGPEDPHVFHDPVRMADAAVIIAERIAEIDEELADPTWVDRGEELADEILAAHADAEQILSEVPERCRKLVTSHDSLSYFAARYGFELIGTVIPGTSSTAGASAGDFAALADAIRDAGVPAIFTDTSESTRLAETLAKEVGEEVAVVALHNESLGDPGSGAETYAGLVRTNATLIADALASCQGG